MKKLLLAVLLSAAVSAAFACSSGDSQSTSANQPTADKQSSGAPAAEPAPVRTETVHLADGSTIVVKTYSDGSKTEERTFVSGPLVKATRRTSSDGTTTARVTHRDTNEETDVKDQSWIDKSMDATGDALATAAQKTKEGAVTAAEATKTGAEKTASATSKAAQKTGSAVKEGAKSVGKGAKKLGSKLKDAVKD